MLLSELINKLNTTLLEHGDVEIEVSAGHLEKGGRFYGDLERVSVVEDYKGKRIRLTGTLEDN